MNSHLSFYVALAVFWDGGWGECPPNCRTAEEQLLERYLKEEKRGSDISEHLSTLRLYSSRVHHITEVGVRSGFSSWALLQGLHDAEHGVAPKVFRAYDIAFFPYEHEARRLSAGVNIDYTFHRGNILETELEETDLLFIDTFHAYPQLRAELRRHGKKAKQFIIMHDTTVDGNFSECVRVHKYMSCSAMADQFGFSVDEVRVGLWPAVQEFLAAQPSWRLVRRYTHNNGLAVLERQILMPALPKARCNLNLINLKTSPHNKPSWTLVPPRIMEERRHFADEVVRRPSAWAHACLGILLAFFVGPIQGSRLARESTMTLANQHLSRALELDPAQPHALLAIAHSLCPGWQRFQCDSGNAALAEKYLKSALEMHDTWEAYLAMGALLGARAESSAALMMHRKALQLQPNHPYVISIVKKLLRQLDNTSEVLHLRDALQRKHQISAVQWHPPPFSEPYWQSVLCWAVVE